MRKLTRPRIAHNIRIGQMPELEIAHKDLKISVRSASKGKLGSLTISRGGIGWVPSGPSNERRFTWEEFADFVKTWKG